MAVLDPWVEASPITIFGSASPKPSPFMLLTNINWLWRLQICVLLLWLCTIWTHQMVLPRSPGWRRLVAAAPAIAALIAAPFFFHPFYEPILSMTTAFMSVRMPVTKLLAACYGRGPLAALPSKPTEESAASSTESNRKLRWWVRRRRRTSDPTVSGAPRANGNTSARGRVPDLPLVTFFMLCPVVPRACHTAERGDGNCEGLNLKGHSCAGDAINTYDSSSTLHRTHSNAYRACGDRRLLLRELAGKWLAFTFTSALAARYGNVAPLAVHAALAYGMLAIMGGLMDLTALYCTIWWGVDLVPPFQNPFQATSLSDFWARRWNVTQSLVLRGLLYDPIVEGRLVPAEAEEAAAYHRHSDRGDGDKDGGSKGGEEGITGKFDATAGGCGAGGAFLSDRGCGDYVVCGGDHLCEVTLHQNVCRRRLVSTFIVRQDDATSDDGDGDIDGGGLDARPREHRTRAFQSKPNAPGLSGTGAIDLARQGLFITQGRDRDDAPANPITAATPVPHIAYWHKLENANIPEGGCGGWGDMGQRWLRAACSFSAIAALASAVAGTTATVMRAATSLRNARVRRMVALLVVFVFSGIEHEIFHWYVQRFVSGQWFTFFAVHGLLLVAEAVLRRTARQWSTASTAMRGSTAVTESGLRRAGAFLAATVAHIPWWVSRIMTLVVLELTASWWFFGVLMEPGVVRRTWGALRGMVPVYGGTEEFRFAVRSTN